MQAIKATKYIAYLRKSTDDKEKQMLSLESQAEVIKRLQVLHDVTIIETIEEKQSAKMPGRPGFDKMMNMIEKGKADGIITWQISRLSRNMKDSGQMMYLTDCGLLKTVITEQTTYSKDSMEQFMFGLQSLTAKLENDRTAYNVKTGMTTCARKGIYPACPPLGYLTDRGGIKGARKREIDPIRFPIIRRMWDLMLTGSYTPYEILNKATELWGLRNRNNIKLCKSQIYNIFNNTFYYGEFEWPIGSGDTYKGIHQPMVTRDEFDRVQKMIGKTGRSRPLKHHFPFAGCSLSCSECESAISGYEKFKTQKNGNKHQYRYYGCNKRKKTICTQKPMREDMLDEQIEIVLKSIQIPEGVHELLMEIIRDENKVQFEAIYAQNEANKQAYGLMLKKIDGLIDMRATGLIDDTQFQSRRIEAEKERDRLRELIKNTDQNVTGWIDTADKMFTFAEHAVNRFKGADNNTKREILTSLGWNLSIKERKLDLSRENWIVPVQSMAKVINENLARLEPISPIKQKTESRKSELGLILCTGEDLNFHSLAGATTSR